MSSEQSNISHGESAPSRGRGRGKSRGGLGKYLRARGRGRGGGRPAEFHKRLVLEDEEVIELEPDSEELKKLERRYGKRRLESNADRYAEPEPVLDSEGEEEIGPEVDLSAFLARQRLEDSVPPSSVLSINKEAEDDSDVDQSLAHLVPRSSSTAHNRKGKIQSVEWNEELEEMRREKEIADANRELKDRFKANVERQKNRQTRGGPTAHVANRKKEKSLRVLEAPPLLSEEPIQKSEKERMEEFLDDLLG
ncbi:hypothetical protein A7U60_g6904 [Sanghuangporus baumii]|uniref:Uncharacterized protein n=1 Tax=Sanghuangporus baumii TaxID=108892 RepID=A0A9Q5HUB4_SANBA|nr:hypothetical protein A7U60_g6904 [Sanghuangporus baumii]